MSFPHCLFLLVKCSTVHAGFFFKKVLIIEHLYVITNILAKEKTLDSALLSPNTWWGGENKRSDKRVGECEKKKCRAPIWLCWVWGTIRQEVINTCHHSASRAARTLLFFKPIKRWQSSVGARLVKIKRFEMHRHLWKKKEKPSTAGFGSTGTPWRRSRRDMAALHVLCHHSWEIDLIKKKLKKKEGGGELRSQVRTWRTDVMLWDVYEPRGGSDRWGGCANVQMKEAAEAKNYVEEKKEKKTVEVK